mgnify:CR=1 FL=1
MNNNYKVNKSITFKDLIVWQKSHKFVLHIYSITKLFPQDEQYGLTQQFRRAAVSIAANISEGFKRIGKNDKLRFYNISESTLEECRYYVILSFDLKYINEETYLLLLNTIEEISKLLISYCQAIKNEGINYANECQETYSVTSVTSETSTSISDFSNDN